MGLQLEVEFESFAELEAFWAAIPPAEHKQWSARMQVRLGRRRAGTCGLLLHRAMRVGRQGMAWHSSPHASVLTRS